MFVKKNILLFFLLMFSGTQAAVTDSLIQDEEQKQLEQCYHYSGLFGYDIDTIANPALYEVISEWMGTRYCYAGDTKEGVDCSGFVSALYKTVFNIELEGSSGAIFKNVKPLKKNELCEGDLVFFRIRRKRVSHVGVYLGRHKFAHASVHEGVIISDLDEPYYKKYFYKGGRKLNEQAN